MRVLGIAFISVLESLIFFFFYKNAYFCMISNFLNGKKYSSAICKR